MFTTENAEISDDFWKRRTRLYFSYYKRAFFIKALKYRRFGNDIVQSVSVIFHGAFRWLFFYNQKPFVRRQLRRCRLRNKIHAIKIRQQPAAFSSTQEQYPSLFGKRFTFSLFAKRRSEQENVFTTNSQNQKNQPHGSERTHFYVRFNNGNYAMHRPTIIFLLSHKITTVQ